MSNKFYEYAQKKLKEFDESGTPSSNMRDYATLYDFIAHWDVKHSSTPSISPQPQSIAPVESSYAQKSSFTTKPLTVRDLIDAFALLWINTECHRDREELRRAVKELHKIVQQREEP